MYKRCLISNAMGCQTYKSTNNGKNITLDTGKNKNVPHCDVNASSDDTNIGYTTYPRV